MGDSREKLIKLSEYLTSKIQKILQYFANFNNFVDILSRNILI